MVSKAIRSFPWNKARMVAAAPLNVLWPTHIRKVWHFLLGWRVLVARIALIPTDDERASS